MIHAVAVVAFEICTCSAYGSVLGIRVLAGLSICAQSGVCTCISRFRVVYKSDVGLYLAAMSYDALQAVIVVDTFLAKHRIALRRRHVCLCDICVPHHITDHWKRRLPVARWQQLQRGGAERRASWSRRVHCRASECIGVHWGMEAGPSPRQGMFVIVGVAPEAICWRH